jgi:hypothetical protein
MRIQEAQKYTVPMDPEPEHCFNLRPMTRLTDYVDTYYFFGSEAYGESQHFTE